MVVPYSNQPTVPRPRGSTIPLTRADETPTAVDAARRDRRSGIGAEGSVGAAHGAEVVRRDEPEVVRDAGAELLEAHGDSDRARARTGRAGVGARAVARARAVLDPPAGGPSVGSTVPPTVAADGASSDAEPVATSGSPWVVNVASAPRVAPEPFEATTR